MDGQPWEQVPSGSTTHPSVQHAGDVASHMALRAKASRLSGVSENPSFSKASVALIRYGLWDFVFIICEGINCPQNPPFPMDSPGNSSDQIGHVNEVTGTGPMGRDVDRTNSTPRTRTGETIGAGCPYAIAGA